MSSISFYNVNVSGEYDLSYVAIDSSGNETEVVIYLYVLPTSNPLPNDYPEMDDNELATIKGRWETERNSLQVSFPLSDFNIYDYYSSLSNLDGNAFFNELKDIIDIRQVKYGEVRFILEKSDTKHSVWGSYQYGMYDSKKLIRYWDGDVTGHALTLNREHVWPNSYLGVDAPGKDTRNIASDPHNLRVIYQPTNSARGNRYFVEGQTSENNTIGTLAYYPGDDHRGDVARILFYMHVRYSDTLYLTNDDNAIINKTLDVLGRIPFGLLDVLLQWHIDDPVDDFEIHRNNIIYMYQGNRNPFIDHPEYASVIFGQTTEGNEFIIVYINMFNDTNINIDDLKPKDKEFIH